MPRYPATAAAPPAAVQPRTSAYRRQPSRQAVATDHSPSPGAGTDLATLSHDLTETPGAALYVWRDDPDTPLLGTVWLEPAETGVMYLGMLTVRPDLQARSLGRTLLHAAEAVAEAKGARRIRMTVVNIRDTLIAWYARRGYDLTGETRPFPYGDRRFGDPLRDDLAFVVLEKAL